ncbi:uncharacterized protein LOC120269192 [Dioscorea cayenensis subsp. rotundata]|uniref:Uncharacterized protein LOC120269192 n=1 Tax=Dioscorea cayennensis subsp. rotundata TaxID=55577 RepID=A0AB40BY96_DIOCR|nr:uncharacterized protein LOC120269192 [Dioscorea cayenensis subsp. rotundata]
MENDSDSESPEEVTAEQSIRQYEEIKKVQKENKLREAHEGKERRRQWAQRRTKEKPTEENVPKVSKTEEQPEPLILPGMLPSNIVSLLAAREKVVFSSDSEEDTHQKPTKRKRRQKNSGPDTVLLKDIPSVECSKNSLEFLKRRKTQVARSSAVLKNANQALRLLSSQGLVSKN